MSRFSTVFIFSSWSSEFLRQKLKEWKSCWAKCLTLEGLHIVSLKMQRSQSGKLNTNGNFDPSRSRRKCLLLLIWISLTKNHIFVKIFCFELFPQKSKIHDIISLTTFLPRNQTRKFSFPNMIYPLQLSLNNPDTLLSKSLAKKYNVIHFLQPHLSVRPPQIR